MSCGTFRSASVLSWIILSWAQIVGLAFSPIQQVDQVCTLFFISCCRCFCSSFSSFSSASSFSSFFSIFPPSHNFYRIDRNNVRFSWDRRNGVLRLVAICNIAPGAEILVPYGSGYARRIKAAVLKKRAVADCVADYIGPVVMSHGAVQRMLCCN